MSASLESRGCLEAHGAFWSSKPVTLAGVVRSKGRGKKCRHFACCPSSLPLLAENIMSKTTPHIRRAREQKSKTIWPDDKPDQQRTALTQQPDFGAIPTAARQRRDNLVGKEAARAFRERAGKRGKTPPLIRRY